MEDKYLVLRTIYGIVKNDKDPTTYPCTLRELILKSTLPTTGIQQQLEELSHEDLVQLKQLDRLVICITEKGIEKTRKLNKPRVA